MGMSPRPGTAGRALRRAAVPVRRPPVEGTLLAGHPAQPGGPGVPVVDDGGAGDEVVEGTALALEHDAEEADAQCEQGEPEPYRPQDGLAATDGPARRSSPPAGRRSAMPSVFPLTAHW